MLSQGCAHTPVFLTAGAQRSGALVGRVGTHHGPMMERAGPGRAEEGEAQLPHFMVNVGHLDRQKQRNR